MFLVLCWAVHCGSDVGCSRPQIVQSWKHLRRAQETTSAEGVVVGDLDLVMAKLQDCPLH
jgi:hypothetical protein